jgi:hypothetical protein
LCLKFIIFCFDEKSSLMNKTSFFKVDRNNSPGGFTPEYDLFISKDPSGSQDFSSSRRGYMTIPLMVMIFLSAPPLFPVKLDLSLHPVMMNNNEKRTEWDIDFIV